MIEGRLIVCIANSWDYDPTSKHQIMKILARKNDILWINYHGTRRPEANRTDFKDVCSALGRVVRGIIRVDSSITQLTPMVIPGATSAFARRCHERMLTAQIKRAVRRVLKGKRKPIQVWSFAPDVPFLVGALGEERFLYYCVDEYTQFDGFDKERIACVEAELIERADVVVTTSQPLLESKRVLRDDVVLVRHGVDFDHFAKAWRCPPPLPSDFPDVNGPVLGFFGVIHHWIDRALIAAVANLRPQYDFVLIGECKVDVDELESLSNVHLLGRRPYEQLPSYCAGFDAALLPFVSNGMTRSVNPVKMCEYLAAGLEIASTSLPEASVHRDTITIAQTPDQFATACDHVVRARDEKWREHVSRTVEHESWASRVEFLSDLITNGTKANESPNYAGQPSRRSCAGVLRHA